MNGKVDRKRTVNLAESLRGICDDYVNGELDDLVFRGLAMGFAANIAGISTDEFRAMLDTAGLMRVTEAIRKAKV